MQLDPCNTRTLKITFAYSDPCGAFLQNCLNLMVVAPDGSSKNSNGFEGDQYDEVNNVEQIVWMDMPASEVKGKKDHEDGWAATVCPSLEL
jgi:serine protease AprX